MVWYSQTEYKVNHAQTVVGHGLKSTVVGHGLKSTVVGHGLKSTMAYHDATTVNHAALPSTMSEHYQTMV